MICPTCQEPLRTQTFDNQQVLHCLNCGSTFFDENSINRITEESAGNLATDKKTAVDQPVKLSCPRDTIFLLPLDKESIPSNVKLFQCPKCKGIFAGPDDLVNFKKAQNAKINYFKIWQIPLPALRAVMLFGFLAVISLTLLLSTSALRQKTLTSTQATDIIQNFSVTTSNRYLFMIFKTQFPVRSKVTFIEQPSGETHIKDISTAFTTLHQLVTGDLDLSKSYLYKITLIDTRGHEVTTEPQLLKIK